ncbi:DUF6491 family protein [Agaribacter marinus]|uniref:Lipoprotein n=1 Tax=Agaribacter marinus TaxID=1431249 RepID=A0AA37SZT1_9ALTE|nr:DUF6491 family protein [Agaribacter marinus]GLR69220.1 hypothetical protein GCM10007852_01280 [Agaribacter marinus]
MKIHATAFAIGASILLSACVSTEPPLPKYDELLKAETQQDGRACIQQRNIRGFGVLEDNVISIDAVGKKDYYLITTIYQCNSLQTDFRAGFKGSFTQLCGGGRDRVITSEESCPIRSIFEFESREEAFSAFNKTREIRENMRQKNKEESSGEETKTQKEQSLIAMH